MSFEEILKSLKDKSYKPVYLLMGEEPYYIDVLTDYIEANVLSEDEKAFNQTVVYGKDIDLKNILLDAKRFPMMSPYQVIIVKEAQNIKDFEPLQSYLAAPQPSTILVFAHKYKSIDGRSSLGKKLKDYEAKSGNLALLDSKAIYENTLKPWILDYVKQQQLTISDKAATMLVEAMGNNLSAIVMEIGKMKVVLGSSTQITEDHVEKYVGVSKEYNAFELLKAIQFKEVSKANKIVFVMSKNTKLYPIQPIVSTFFGAFSKLLIFHQLADKSDAALKTTLNINNYYQAQDMRKFAQCFSIQKARQCISLLREYDMKSKGFGNSSADSGDLLKELVFKVLN